MRKLIIVLMLSGLLTLATAVPAFAVDDNIPSPFPSGGPGSGAPFLVNCVTDEGGRLVVDNSGDPPDVGRISCN